MYFLNCRKMNYFWHIHFTNSAEKVQLVFPNYHQNALTRQYALGNFKTLAHKICRDYAMSVYLDGWTNTNTDPQENFAREFIELYTLGKGEQIAEGNYTTYTEEDVRAAAKILTGFVPIGYFPDAQIPNGYTVETDPDTGLYRSNIITFYHDFSTKQFSSAFGNASISTGGTTIAHIENELSAFIDLLFNQNALAAYIVRRLYRFFCYYDITPEIETDIIQPLATTFRNSNYEIVPVLKQLLKSQHFFDSDDSLTTNNNIGAIIKSPFEVVVSAFKYFQIPYGTSANWQQHHDALIILDGFLTQMDMTLFEAPEVAGYPAYHQEPYFNRNWLSASTLVNRYGGFALITYGFTYGSFTLKFDTVDYLQNSGVIANPGDVFEIVDTVTNDLYPFGIDATKRTALRNLLVDAGDPDYYWTNEWNTYTGGGTDATVRLRLNAFFNAILQSPEFQLS